MLHSSELYEQTQGHLAEHGISVKGAALDLKKMMARKDGVVKTLTGGVAGLLKKNKVKVFTRHGHLQCRPHRGDR